MIGEHIWTPLENGDSTQQKNNRIMAHHSDGPDPIKVKSKQIEKLQKEKETLLEEKELKNKRAVELSETLKTLKEEKAEIERKLAKISNDEKYIEIIKITNT